MNFNDTEKNAYLTVKTLLKKAQINVSDTGLKNTLWYHPDFPSMASISDVLKDFKIENIGTRIEVKQLQDIPLPCIAHINNGRGLFFATITDVNEDEIEFWINGKKFNEHLSQFMRKWSGLVLLIQQSNQSGEEGFRKKYILERLNLIRLPLIIISSIFIILYLWSSKYQIILNPTFALLTIKILGLLVSGLLVWYGFDSNNSFLLNICNLNEKTNCSSILESKGAKLLGIISWAEIGLFYFSGGILSLFMFQKDIDLLIILNYFSLAFVPFSIYYQYSIIKKWCALCIVVQVLFLIEFSIGHFLNIDFHIENSILSFVVSFAIFPLQWLLIKPNYQKGHYYESTYKELRKVTFSAEYIQTLETYSSELPPYFEGMKEIVLGDDMAPYTLTIAVNPTCKACSKHLIELNQIIEKNHTLKIRIFLASGTNPYRISDRVSMELLSLPESEISKKILEWFIQPDYKKWSLKNKINISEESKKQIELATRWLNIANVKYTPTVFLQNLKLPSFYEIRDIPKLCDIIKTNEDSIKSYK